MWSNISSGLQSVLMRAETKIVKAFDDVETNLMAMNQESQDKDYSTGHEGQSENSSINESPSKDGNNPYSGGGGSGVGGQVQYYLDQKAAESEEANAV